MIQTYTTPLSRDDAQAIRHQVEHRLVVAAEPTSTAADAVRYSEAVGWIEDLLQGHPVVIDDEALAFSRRVVERRRMSRKAR